MCFFLLHHLGYLTEACCDWSGEDLRRFSWCLKLGVLLIWGHAGKSGCQHYLSVCTVKFQGNISDRRSFFSFAQE